MRRGKRLGKYRLAKRIGSGSFAEVWKARDVIEQRDVALKIATPGVVDLHGREEVEHEARIASKLAHPNILSVRNADWIDGHFVLATDLAEKNLAQYAGARRSASVALRVLRDVAAGLAFAHERRVVHRDLKPENILIFKDRRAALADFGVARFAKGPTHVFTEVGTLGYMAPEQAYGRPSYASDVFSLGLIGYEILAGELPTWPFEAPLAGQRRLESRVPRDVARLLRRSIQLDSDRRPPDATHFHQELEKSLARSARKPPVRRRKSREVEEETPFEVETKLFLRRYQKSLGLAYDCFRCGGPISEAMSFCPWCRTKENSLIEVTNYPLVCPECEHGVRPEWTSCPWCFRGHLEGNGKKPRIDSRAERSCARRGCDGELRVFMRYCPVCKERPRRPWSHPDLAERCHHCRGPVHRLFWRFCPWCGRGTGRPTSPATKRRPSR